jgi:hypothetical protein
MKEYPFVSSALPSLEIGHPPLLHFQEFMDLAEENLSAEDLARVRLVQTFIDLNNVRSFWQGNPCDPRGAIPAEEIEMAIEDGESYPSFFYDFLDKYDSIEKRLRYFSWLLVRFFKEYGGEGKGFLYEYLNFEREWRLIMAAFRSKVVGRDISLELQFDDPSELIVAHILAQKEAKTYEPVSEYEELKGVFEAHKDAPLALHRALCEYQFIRIEQLTEGELFSIDRILGYMTQLMIVERWLELNEKEGLEIVDKMIEEAK